MVLVSGGGDYVTCCYWSRYNGVDGRVRQLVGGSAGVGLNLKPLNSIAWRCPGF